MRLTQQADASLAETKWLQSHPCHHQPKKQVQSFIGMIKHLAKFSPRLSEFAELIRELAKEKLPFNWRHEYLEDFACLKKEITSGPMLAY